MIQRDYLIVGAGLAGACVCEGLRTYDKTKSVTLVGAEPELPYHRPPLSKEFLEAKKPDFSKLPRFDRTWYEKRKIELRLDTVVRAFNAERRLAVLANGETIEFRKAALAMGSRAKRPPVAGATLGNVFYLRSLRDALAIREMAANQKSIVIVGGGLLAVEVSAALTAAGSKVMLLDRDPLIWSRWLDKETAQWLTRHLESRGVHLKMQQDLKGFEGKTVLKNVATKQGDRFPVGMAIVAVGATPNIDLLQSTPLHSPNGTPVNDYLETDEKGIFAAGDIALFPDRVFGGARRIEHWDNAIKQGLTAGANITGKKRQKYDYVQYFNARAFDLNFEFYGDFSRAPSQVEIEGEREKGSFILRYTELGRLRAVVLCNQKSGGEEAVKAIRTAHRS